MRCPVCQHPKTAVVDSQAKRTVRRRRRHCRSCEFKFWTEERVLAPDLNVIVVANPRRIMI